MMGFDNTKSEPMSSESLQKCFDELKKARSEKWERLFPQGMMREPIYIRPVWISEEDFKEMLKF